MSIKKFIRINGLAGYESGVTGETGREATIGALVEFLSRVNAGFAMDSRRD
jgi:hypothetical protein